MTAEGTRRARPRWLLAVGLFILAPFVGEFLLGNTPITAAPWALMLAPLYGGGAVLVREVGRRAGGWPTMFLLAAAYALVEEGWVDQMLYNPGYLGSPDFADLAPIPGLHISASLTVTSLVLHSVWSICVPIAIMEAFEPVPGMETRPWLGRAGLTVTVLIFVVGSTTLAFTQWDERRFVGSALQFGVTGIVIALLIMVGLRTRRSEPQC